MKVRITLKKKSKGVAMGWGFVARPDSREGSAAWLPTNDEITGEDLRHTKSNALYV